ncbi:hypothetical protein CCL15_00440 [Pseudomonas syringae]|nr:hypothetical protein CCL15_00440 [Pseudomonas syringae]
MTVYVQCPAALGSLLKFQANYCHYRVYFIDSLFIASYKAFAKVLDIKSISNTHKHTSKASFFNSAHIQNKSTPAGTLAIIFLPMKSYTIYFQRQYITQIVKKLKINKPA